MTASDDHLSPETRALPVRSPLAACIDPPAAEPDAAPVLRVAPSATDGRDEPLSTDPRAWRRWFDR